MSPAPPDDREPRVVGPGFHARVYRVVGRIPRGRVVTYGDVAEALGSRRVARHVGHALAALPTERRDVPWHRVVNGQGHVSRRGDGAPSLEQVLRLTAEGVAVHPNGKLVDFRRVRTTLGANDASTGRPGSARREDVESEA